MAIEPISPDEALGNKQIPDEVLETINSLLLKKFNGYPIVIKQDEIIKILVDKGLNRQEIFDQHWLDFENLYRQAGWKVEYDKPGYNEDYEAYFRFSKKGTK